MLVVAVTCDCP